LAPGIAVAQAIGRLGNYFNQELFGSPTTLPWGLDVYLRTPGGVSGTVADCAAAGATPEFPTTYLKASPEVLCGTFHPTFLYELIWDVGVALLVVWADRRFRLGHGRAFAVYVAGYTAGRAWIEMLRIDHANHILGLRVNVLVAIAVFLAAVVYLVLTRKLGREDPAVVWGPDVGRRGTHGDAGPAPVPAASTSPAADPAPDDPMPVDPELEDPEPDDPGPGGPIIDDREPGDSALGDPEPADPERTGAQREETPRT
jgi:hypothetical protein